MGTNEILSSGKEKDGMSTYLLVNLAAVIIPFAFSFHPSIRFHRRYSTFWPACLFVAAIFILWDMWFTHIGVWGFNPTHLTEARIFNLPVEEILFFICIPYACVFTYHCFKKLNVPAPGSQVQKVVTLILSAVLLTLVTTHPDRAYTVTTFTLLSVSLLILQFISRPEWLGRFYVSYLVLLIPFFAVNGILTGSCLEQPVVWYNDNENLGLRLLTIPVEDVFYGMLLIIWNVALMEILDSRRLHIRALWASAKRVFA